MTSTKRVNEEAINLRLIPLRGDWVTWEFYKALNGIEEGGYIGDMFSGEYVYRDRYFEYLRSAK